jgi:hypothetical protein
MVLQPVALAETGLAGGGLWLGGRVADGDFEAEGLELVEVAADLAVAVAVEFVPVGAEVGEAGFGVVEEVPDDDEDGAGDGAPGPERADAAGQAALPFAEEGGGAGGAGGGLGAVALEVGVALSLAGLAAAGPDWRATGASPAQETRWSAVGNRVMSRPVSAMIALASLRLTPGISASRPAAGRAAAPGSWPACGLVSPLALIPQEAGMASRRPRSRHRAPRRTGPAA